MPSLPAMRSSTFDILVVIYDNHHLPLCQGFSLPFVFEVVPPSVLAGILLAIRTTRLAYTFEGTWQNCINGAEEYQRSINDGDSCHVRLKCHGF